MLKKHYLEHNRPAFTLLEMLVSLSIIMLMSLLFITNYQSGTRRTDLIMTAQGLVADIHFVQNNSLGLVRYGENVPAGGWGINFNKLENSYTIFADLEKPGDEGYLKFNENTEYDRNRGGRKITFANGVTIEDIKILKKVAFVTTSISTNQANVTFLPPDPVTNIFNAITYATGTEMIINLKDSQGSSKSIKLNFLGLAEVID